MVEIASFLASFALSYVEYTLLALRLQALVELYGKIGCVLRGSERGKSTASCLADGSMLFDGTTTHTF
jgi:hypothetical protein